MASPAPLTEIGSLGVRSRYRPLSYTLPVRVVNGKSEVSSIVTMSETDGTRATESRLSSLAVEAAVPV